MKMSIICVYNKQDVLDDNLLKSLDQQENKNYELILVDNRDNSFSSAAVALNYGASEATGDYLVFVHQDIYLSDSTWIDDTLETLSSLDNVGIVGVAGKTTDSIVRGNIKQGVPSKPLTSFTINKPQKAITLDECLFIIPHDIYMKYPLDEDICPDWHLYAVDYVYNIKCEGFNAYLIPSNLEHRSTGASMSEGYYTTLPALQKKYRDMGLIRTCMGDWFTKIPVSIQRFVKRFKMY